MRRQCPRGGDDLGEVLVGADKDGYLDSSNKQMEIYILQIDKASYFHKS